MTKEQYKKATSILEELYEINHEIERASQSMENPFGHSHVLDEALESCRQNCVALLKEKKKQLEQAFSLIYEAFTLPLSRGVAIKPFYSYHRTYRLERSRLLLM